MMAKFAQKQVHQPPYDEFKTNWDQYNLKGKAYWPKFKSNTNFPLFAKEYCATIFIKRILVVVVI